MIDKLLLPRTIAGLGDNLLTIARPASGIARVRCMVKVNDDGEVCGLEVGCRVVAERVGGERNTMDGVSFQFWLAHFLSQHPDLLPAKVRAEL